MEGGIIMSLLDHYKYWKVNKDKSNEEKRIIEFVKIDNIENKWKEAKKDYDDSKEKYEDIKKEYNKALGNGDIESSYIEAGKEFQKAKDYAFKLYDQYKLLDKNKGMTISIERLKDKNSRKEYVSVTILRNGDNDGTIISSLKNLSDKINELDDYGVYLEAVHYDELKKIIRDEYFELTAKLKDFADNNVPEKVVTEYVKICKEKIVADIEENKTVKKKDTEKVTIKDNHCFVPVAMFRAWHEGSEYRNYKIADIKEALIKHNFCHNNTGRNDFTVKGIGKVICFDTDMIGVKNE